MGSYLAINKTGMTIPVYQYYSSVKIGDIYPNERFTYMKIQPEDAGGGQVYIKFLNPSGQYVDGMCYFSSNDGVYQFGRRWSDYNFGTITLNGQTAYALKTDRNVNIYTTGASYVTTLPAGSTVYTDKQSTAGATHPDWLYLLGYNRYGYPETHTCFVDTGVARNSMDTGVYGSGF